MQICTSYENHEQILFINTQKALYLIFLYSHLYEYMINNKQGAN